MQASFIVILEIPYNIYLSINVYLDQNVSYRISILVHCQFGFKYISFRNKLLAGLDSDKNSFFKIRQVTHNCTAYVILYIQLPI